jgi:flagellar protein FliS
MSMNAQAYDTYRKSTVETVAPGKLLIMLYDGAIRNLKNAREAIESKELDKAHQHIIKAQDIILEFMSTLNMDYEISQQLLSLYEYFYQQLVQANIKKDVKLLDEVSDFLVQLRDTWTEAQKKVGSAVKTTPQPVSRTADQMPAKGFSIKG